MAQPHRPTEEERALKVIEGEVVCSLCQLPVGHPDCSHITDQKVWRRLSELHDVAGNPGEHMKLWGIPFPIDPPKNLAFHGENWVKPRDQNADYIYTSPAGWRLHVRKDDYTGYAYSIHYETCPSQSISGKVLDIAMRNLDRFREQNNRIRGKYRYAEPVDLCI